MSKDVQACRSDIRREVPTTIQPPWLPPLVLTDSGVVLGTVGNSHPTWLSQEAYRQALARCLTARGYESEAGSNLSSLPPMLHLTEHSFMQDGFDLRDKRKRQADHTACLRITGSVDRLFQIVARSLFFSTHLA